MKNNKLLYLATFVLLVCVILSLFTLIYVVTSRDTINSQIKESIQEELKGLDVKVDKNDTLNESQILLAVAKYCETRNDCKGVRGEMGWTGLQGSKGIDGISIQGPQGIRGEDGKDGITPPCYFTINKCVGADGYTPQKNIDYFDGQNGSDGRNVERRCNSDNNRMEWRLIGDDTWQSEYNLAPGQTCVQEEVP